MTRCYLRIFEKRPLALSGVVSQVAFPGSSHPNGRPGCGEVGTLSGVAFGREFVFASIHYVLTIGYGKVHITMYKTGNRIPFNDGDTRSIYL